MASVPGALSLEGTYGAFAITKDVSAVLLGCLTVQTYLYFRSFPRDSLVIKILLVLIWALELASYAVSSRLIYKLTIVKFGDVLALIDQFQGPISIVLWLCSASIAFMESFYIVYICDVAGRRLWTMCGAAVALLIIWLRCVGFLVIATRVRRELPISNWLLKLELVSGMVMEILIALVMAWFLRKRTFEDVEGPLKWVAWVLRWTLQTGALAGIIALVNLGMNPSKDNPFLFIGLVNVLSKVLSNCFVSSINGRKDLQGFTEMHLANNSPLQESSPRTREQDDDSNPNRPNRITTAFRAFIRELNIFDLAPKGTAAVSNNVNLDDEWRQQDPERFGTQGQGQNHIQHAASGPGPMPQMVQQHSTPVLNTPILNIATQPRAQGGPGPGPSSLPMSVTRTKNRPPPPPPHLPQPDSDSRRSDKEIQEIPHEPANRYGNLVPEAQATGVSAFTPSASLQVKPSSQSQYQKSQPKFIVANTTASRTSGIISSPAHTRNNTLTASGRESMDTLPSYRSRATTPAPATPVSPGIVGFGLSGKGKEREMERRTLPPLPRIPQANDQDRTVDDSASVVDMERSNGEVGEEHEEVQEEEREGATDRAGPGSPLD